MRELSDLSDLSEEEEKPYGPIAGDILRLLSPDDLEDAAHAVPNGSTSAVALLELVRKPTPDKVAPDVAQFGGKILQMSLPNETEEKLQAAMNQSGAEQPAAAAEAQSNLVAQPTRHRRIGYYLVTLDYRSRSARGQGTIFRFLRDARQKWQVASQRTYRRFSRMIATASRGM